MILLQPNNQKKKIKEELDLIYLILIMLKKELDNNKDFLLDYKKN